MGLGRGKMNDVQPWPPRGDYVLACLVNNQQHMLLPSSAGCCLDGESIKPLKPGRSCLEMSVFVAALQNVRSTKQALGVDPCSTLVNQLQEHRVTIRSSGD